MDVEYTKDNPLCCFFAFEGYNSQGLALNRLKQHYPDFDWVCVGRSEIDKYAIQAADALFPEAKDKNHGDISKISWNDVPDFDLLTYSFPCTNLSFAGKQEGCEEGSGTESSLLWECRKAIIAKRPKYLLMENVKALVSQKFLPYFIKWQNELASYGYSNFAKVLNASSYGIPQNRERIFMVSILDDNASYHFPEPFPLDKRLKDVLEEEVDEKYYLKTNQIEYIYSTSKNGIKRQGAHEVEDIASAIVSTCYKGNNMNCIKEPIACAMRGREVQCLTPKRTEYGKQVRKEYESGELKESRHNMQQLEPRTDGVCNTITSVQKDNLIVEPKILSYTRDANGKVVDRHFKDVANTIHGGTGGGGNTDSFVVEPSIVIGSTQKNAYVGSVEGISPCINAACGMGGGQTPMVADEQMYRIRKLTPRECFRLMDVDDEDIDKIQAVGISRSQQYKLAGNSICVGVLFHIFRKLFIDTENENKQLTLF